MTHWADDNSIIAAGPPARVAGWMRLAARFAIIAERLWPDFFTAAMALAGLLIAALFGLWSVLPGWLHAAALFGVALIWICALWRAARVWHWPDNQAALARIEADSGLAHQPLRTLADWPAGDAGGFGDALWRRHQARAALQAKALSLRLPRLNWLAQDPWALRGLLLLLLALGVAVAGPRAGARLGGAFLPDLGGVSAMAHVEAWITPPDYTGLAPIMLPPGGADKAVDVPAGATLTALMSGGWRTPRLELAGQTTAFEETATRQYRLEAAIAAGDALIVRQGWRALVRWPVNVLPDIAPLVSFIGQPAVSANHALIVDYALLDDYGVADLALDVTGPVDMIWPAQRYMLTPPPMRRGDEARGTAYRDFTASPWAGEQVTLILEARDALGQIGQSRPVELLLPERPFTHPVAKDIALIRKRLFRAPADRGPVLSALGRLSAEPAAFGDDLTVFMALRNAYWRLTHDLDVGAVPPVAAVLWDAAVALEEGAVGQARTALRERIEELMAALAQGGDTDAMMQALEAQLAEFLRAQAQAMMEEGGPQTPMPDGAVLAISPEMLEKMLEHLRAQAATGDVAGAMETLAALQSMMENMTMGPGPSAADMARAMAGQQALNGLEAARRDQGALSAQTGAPGQDGAGLADAQDGLAGRVGKLGETLGAAGMAAPGALDEAQAYMDGAAGALRQGRQGQARTSQGQAEQALDRAIDSVRQGLQQMMQAMTGAGGMRDPAGRATGGAALEDVTIPSDADFATSRAILDEVRRRLADPARPQAEREYLERLLERF